MKKWVPNIITLSNLLCGCIAAIYAFNDQLVLAGIFVGAGIFFDFFDGLAARLLNVSSELGKQLDSLADMVTSGLVPGIVMYQMLSEAIHMNLTTTESINFFLGEDLYWITHPYTPVIGFLITLGSCYRLAKFNIDTRQTDSFIGVPTPANAILIISLGIIAQDYNNELTYFLTNPYILIVITLISVYLLNAELPLFALKFKQWGIKGNVIRYLFLLISLVLLITLQIYAVPCIIIIYILMSVINNLMIKRQ
ncbi:CDP-diacylglycerol--serine O-phosphatidyltransferase [Nonlabens dokdonensis]|jgi:CDP-diacylglycerol--serine O-phosphatidyltransferase|uniref:Phosphatidylserine synthase n=2 Tax=Nonlabens dokdonensis TaxID=328515 RepID=L7W4X8_NONDD|nr:CDP-alcohol phosphatidyltransferase family protein [Nonlabens dokdonensis]AGC75212.1 phosphatidylserine synthase [Nonlabens dokdonensis DSW-6]PZX39047.1 CDP-diacylglycerol--serine O-phosphatidyltransferase [Nonlabens dokdonensis]